MAQNQRASGQEHVNFAIGASGKLVGAPLITWSDLSFGLALPDRKPRPLTCSRTGRSFLSTLTNG